jgi:hypothetical protein
MIYFRGMKDCLQCSEPLVHVPGRKEKSFCDVNCRNKYFYAKRKKEIEDAKALLVSLPSDFIEIKKVAILTNEGEVKPIFPSPRKKPKKTIAEELGGSVDFSKKAANESYDSPRRDFQDEYHKAPISKPRTLDELKALCPPELTGFDKSNWISIERQKYGI